MKLVTAQIENLELSSPQEVIEFRKNLGSGKSFDFTKPVTEEIQAKIDRIHLVHGFGYEKAGCGLIQSIQNRLVFEYDFESGYNFIFSPSHFPDHLTEDSITVENIIARVKMILEAFGWQISFSADSRWYYFDFAPLEALIP